LNGVYWDSTINEIIRRHPDLSIADLETAWEYYEQNRDEIDAAIRLNAGA
jgi:uncharacterized protein (DUF433 family)